MLHLVDTTIEVRRTDTTHAAIGEIEGAARIGQHINELRRLQQYVGEHAYRAATAVGANSLHANSVSGDQLLGVMDLYMMNDGRSSSYYGLYGSIRLDSAASRATLLDDGSDVEPDTTYPVCLSELEVNPETLAIEARMQTIVPSDTMSELDLDNFKVFTDLLTQVSYDTSSNVMFNHAWLLIGQQNEAAQTAKL